MSSPNLNLFSLLLLLSLATSAAAQDDPASRVGAGGFSEGFDQALYKGLVGNVLDSIPMDPSKRLDLQRTNAVVGNTLLGRSLSVLVGLSNPVLLLGGFVWGVWAASNIKPAAAPVKLTADPVQSGGAAAAQERVVARLVLSSAIDDTPANKVSESILLSSNSYGDADVAAASPSHVVKIWLPQRSPELLR